MRRVTVTIFFLSLFCCFRASAQPGLRDSVNVYRSRIARIYRQTWDSLRKSDSVVYYGQRLKQLSKRAKAYGAFALYAAAGNADFANFNKAIAKDGFGPLNGPVWGIGMGYSGKGYTGVMFDLDFWTIGTNRTVRKNDEAIKATYSSLFRLHLGYAIVNTRVFSLYPYAGLSLRFSNLEYSKPQTVNATWNSVVGIVQNNQAVFVESTHLSYQAGLGMDLLLTKADKPGGVMLFGKFGTNGIFGHETYDIYGVKYDPGIKYGSWEASLGFKFFGRR